MEMEIQDGGEEVFSCCAQTLSILSFFFQDLSFETICKGSSKFEWINALNVCNMHDMMISKLMK